jgi:hypothetical protein
MKGEKEMNTSEHMIETRKLGQFDRLVLRDGANWVDLVIREGEQETLTIHAPQEMLSRIRTDVRNGTLKITLAGTLMDKLGDALTTSLTRKHVRYEVAVHRLSTLKVTGLVRIDTRGLGQQQPAIRRGEPNIPMPGFMPRW